MKKLLTTCLLLFVLYYVYDNYIEIGQFIMQNIVYKEDTIIKDANSYEKNMDWSYVQETDDFSPNEKQDILNIFYTALNKGWDEVIFYCPTSYETCEDDINEIASDPSTLSYINNFVATYNSYSRIYVNINSFGRVDIKITKTYDSDMIAKIDKRLDEILASLITDDMTEEQKIKAIHDFILDGTVYDQERSNEIKNGIETETTQASNTAYGPLYYGKAICGGYTDLMALFLDRLGIPNFKVSSENHIWNVVYYDNSWRHLDLTWDDPVVNTGENIITYNYYLITTEELKNINDDQHDYDSDVFKEIN
jgi:hypothetical protein